MCKIFLVVVGYLKRALRYIRSIMISHGNGNFVYSAIVINNFILDYSNKHVSSIIQTKSVLRNMGVP